MMDKFGQERIMVSNLSVFPTEHKIMKAKITSREITQGKNAELLTWGVKFPDQKTRIVKLFIKYDPKDKQQEFIKFEIFTEDKKRVYNYERNLKELASSDPKVEFDSAYFKHHKFELSDIIVNLWQYEKEPKYKSLLDAIDRSRTPGQPMRG